MSGYRWLPWWLVVASTVLTLSWAKPAKAQWLVAEPTLQGLATTNLEVTLQTFGLQGEQLAQAVETVAQVTSVLETLNESLAVARTIKRAYEMLRNYDWEDLKRDSKAALYRVIPELHEAEREWNELRANGRAIENGSFWGRQTYKDMLTDRLLASAATYGYQNTLTAIVGEKQRPNKVSEAERAVEGHFRRAKMMEYRINAELGYRLQATKLGQLVREVESGKQLDLKIEATNALSTHQIAKNTQLLHDAKMAELAKRETSDRLRREGEENFKNAILEHEESFLGVGIVR